MSRSKKWTRRRSRMIHNTATAELVENVVVKKGDGWYVKSEDGKNLGGPYKTEAEAEDRLKEVEQFKHMNANTFSMITANIRPRLIRNDSMAGRDYTVVPMVMIVEGILNGSNGPLLYPAKYLKRTPEIWNMKPVIVYHPEANGMPISACDPDILTNRQVGVIMNTKFEDGKLKAEAWIEIERAKVVDERILKAIENGEMMELSTGLISDVVKEEGDWNGQHYNGIALNYRPDHLALLPDQKGACSIDDGAGFLRNSRGEDREPVIAQNKQSHDALRQALQKLIDPSAEVGPSSAWIADVYDDFFVYEKDGKLYAQDYKKIEPAGVELDGDKREVVRVIEYRTLDGSFVGNTEKEKQMNKEQLVAAIIANSGQFTEEDKDTLMGLDETVLEKMSKITPVANDEEKVTPEEPAVDTEEETTVVAPVATENKEQTVEEYIANAPAGIRDMIINGLQTHAAEKAKLVAAIVANDRCDFTKEQLQTKPLAELKTIAKLAAPVANKKSNTGVDFSALGLTVENTETVKEEPLAAPTMNFEK